jgi:hypothetical protein
MSISCGNLGMLPPPPPRFGNPCPALCMSYITLGVRTLRVEISSLAAASNVVSYKLPTPSRLYNVLERWCGRTKVHELDGKNHILIFWLPKLPNVLPVSHIHTSCHTDWSGSGWTRSPVIFSLYVNDIRYVELAQYADDTALIATTRSPSLLVGNLEAYLGRVEHWLRNWRIAITSEKTPLCYLLRLRNTFKSPDQSSFSKSQQSGSKQHGMSGTRKPGRKEGSL